MSNSVDQRIVEMQFDASQFEKGIESTLSALKNLDSSLKLENGDKGLETISKSLNDIGKNVEETTSKFSVLGAAAFTAVNKVTSSLIDMGTSALKSVTIQPLLDGLDEYNLKMNSIKTIQTNTGESLENVSKALDELNHYADKTIYNFAEMTQNIGRFTTAGVDLETSTKSIQGISNLAAAAGSDAGQATRAMYNLSQALATGKLTLLDWKSVEYAGMGGTMFQNALIDTARAYGIEIDSLIEKNGSFRDSLKEGWVTNEVLTQTLENFTYATNEMTEAEVKATTAKLKSLGYTDKQIEQIYKMANAAQESATKVRTFSQLIGTISEELGSGWAQTWEYIIGDLEEAEDLFTMVSDGIRGVIGAIADARNAFFKDWHDAGGRDSLIGIMTQLAQLLPNIAKPFTRAFELMTDGLTGSGFAGMLADALDKVTEFVKMMNGSFKETGSSIGVAFRTVRRVIAVDVMAIIAGVKAIGSAVANIFGGVIVGAFNALTGAIRLARQIFLRFGQLITDIIVPGLENMLGGIGNFLESIGLGDIPKMFDSAAKAIGSFFKATARAKTYRKEFANNLNGVVDAVSSFSSKVGDVFSKVGQVIENFLSGMAVGIKENIGKLKEGFDVFNELVGTPVVNALKSAFESLGNALSSIAESIANSDVVPQFMKDFASGVSDLFGAMNSSDGSAFTNFLNSVKELGRGIASNALTAMGDGIKNVAQAFKEFSDTHGEKIVGMITGAFESLGQVWGFIEPVIASIRDTVTGLWDAISGAFADAGISIEPFIELFENLGESLGKFMDNIGKNGFSLEALGAFVEDIKGNFASLGSEVLPSVSNFADGIVDNISKMEGPIGDFVGWVGKISGPMTTMSENFDKNTQSLSNVIDKIKGKSDEAKGGESGAEGVLGTIQDTVGDEQTFDQAFNLVTAFEKFVGMITNPIATISNFVKGGLKGISTGISEFVKGLDVQAIGDFVKQIVGIGIGGGTVYALLEFGEVMRSMAGVATSIKGFIDAVKTIPDSLKNISKAIEGNIKTQAILNIAIALGIIVAAIIALTFTDLDKAYAALPMILGLLLSLAAVVTVFGKLSAIESFNVAGIASFTSAMLSMAVAVGIMAVVVGILGGMDPGQLDQGTTVLTEFLAIILIFTLINRKIPSGGGNIGASLKGIALAMIAMAAVVKILGGMDESELAKGMEAIEIMSLCITMIIGMMSLLNGKSLPAGGGGGSNVLAQAALLIASIAASLYVLGRMDTGQLVQGGIAIAAIIGVLTGIVYLLNRFKPKVAMNGATTLVALAGAVFILAGALAGLAMIGQFGGDLKMATIAISALIGMFSVLVYIAGKAGPQLSMSVAAISEMGLVMGVLAASLIAMSLVPLDKLAGSLLIMVGALAAFVGAMALLGVITKYIPASNAALLEMAVVMGVLTVALLALSQIDSKQLIMSVIGFSLALAALVVAFAGLAAIGEFLSFGVIMISVAMVALGASLLLAGIGIAAAVVSFAIFVDSLTKLGDIAPGAVDNLIEAIKRLGTGLWDAREQMALGIMGIGYAMISGFLGLIPMAVMAIAQFVGQLAAALVAAAPLMGYGAVQVVAGLVDGFARGLDEHGMDILNALLHLGEVIINGVKDILVQGLNDFNAWLYDITGGLMGAAPPAKDAVAQLSTEVSNGYKENLKLKGYTEEELAAMKQDLANSKEGVKAESKGVSEAATQGFMEGGEGFEWLKSLHIDPESMDQSFGSFLEGLQEQGVTIPSEFSSFIESGLGDAIPIGDILGSDGNLNPEALNGKLQEMGVGGVTEGFGPGIEEGAAEVDVYSYLTQGGTFDQDAIVQDFHNTGVSAAQGFNSGFNDSIKVDGEGPAKKAAKAMTQESAFRNAGRKDGQAAVNGINTGSRDMASKVRSNADKARQALSDKRSSMKSTGESVGRAAGEGVAVGMESMAGRVKAAADRIVAEVDRALRAKAKISSPSKLTAEIGGYLVEGLIVGMNSLTPSLVNTSENVMGEALSALSTQASYMDGLLDDIDDQPVIRPVLDLTDYEAGLYRMNGLSTATPMVTAQAAGRLLGYSTESQTAASPSTGNTINISLNYEAGADANQMVMDIARGLQSHVIMEGV